MGSITVTTYVKEYLQKEYPQRRAIRIQEVAAFAQCMDENTPFTVEKMTDMAVELPLNVRRALVRNFHIYSCSDDKFYDTIKKNARESKYMKLILKALLFLYLVPIIALESTKTVLDFTELAEHFPPELQQVIFNAYLQKILPDNTWVELNVLAAREFPFNAVAFNHDGSLLASASDDNAIRLWDPHSGDQLNVLWGHDGGVIDVAFNQDGSLLASASIDKTIRLWNPQTCQKLHILRGHLGGVKSVAFDHDGSQLASGSFDNTIRLWEPSSGKLLHILTGHHSWVNCVVFNHDGSKLASGSLDGSVRLWNAHDGQQLHILTGYGSWPDSVVFNHNDTQLASAFNDKTIRLWDPKSGDQLGIFRGNNASVTSVAFNHDSTLLASASNDKTIRLWNPKNGQVFYILKGHNDWVSHVIFNHDGVLLASTSSDKTIRLWGDSKKILSDFFKKQTSVNIDQYELILLLANYKDLLQKKYQQRKAIRIQDVATFACNIHKKTDFTVEKMTHIARELPLHVRRALVRNFQIYSCSDAKFYDTIKKMRQKANK